ncbi:MAG TPA: hypothetical protein EYP30_04245 [Archaeoglobaceae archaeon]|nr:hypothetical protein [Archaeoglobaceae archaeon]
MPLKIVLLAIIALRREWDYKSLERVWMQFVPHPKAYYMMGRYIKSLKASSSIEKPKKGRVRITEWGWKKCSNPSFSGSFNATPAYIPLNF